MRHCTRCGLCCTLSLCSKGRRKDKNKRGNCKFLIRHEDRTTSCQLVIEGKMPSDTIDFNEGCAMQENYPKMYEFQTEYRKAMNELRKQN